MADNDAAVDGKDNSEEVKGAKGGRLKKLILALLLGLISLSLGLVAAVGVDGVSEIVGSGASSEASDEDGKDVEDKDKYAFVNFDEMIVNISGYSTAGRKVSRFMKIKISMVIDAGHAEEVEKKKIFLRDNFQNYLRELDEREIEGSKGIESLRVELLKRAKAVVGKDAPKEILIGELIIQ